MSKLRYQPIRWEATIGPYVISIGKHNALHENKYMWTFWNSSSPNNVIIANGFSQTLPGAKEAAESDLMLEMGWEE